MITLEAKFNQISDYIDSLNIITYWGGWCHNMTDKDIPYGLGITAGCEGNIYSFNDNGISGYLFFRGLSSTNSSIKNEIRVTGGIYIFTPHKFIGELNNTYQLPLTIFGKLNKRFTARYNFTIDSVTGVRRFEDKEMALISFDFLHYGDCTLPTIGYPIC